MPPESPNKTSTAALVKPKDGRAKPRPGPEEQGRAIAAAAVALFLKHGSSTVSIMQICDAADVSRSTFYRCFGDKDILLEHLYQVSVVEPVAHFMLTDFQQSDLSAGDMRSAVDRMFEAIFSQGDYAELVFREANDPYSPAFRVVNGAFDSLVTSLQKVVSPCGDKDVDAVFLKSLLNANQWIAHNAIAKGLTPRNKQIAKDAAWQLVRKALDFD